MKKIVRLTENDLVKLVKRIINEQGEMDSEGNEDIQYVVKTLKELNLVDSDQMNVYDDNFELYSIKGKRFDYFEKSDGYLVFEVEPEDDFLNLFVSGEDYGEDGDAEMRFEVYRYIMDNWFDVLEEKNIILQISPFDEVSDEFY
jgi:hypothetical protein